jgi:hypothetical protein
MNQKHRSQLLLLRPRYQRSLLLRYDLYLRHGGCLREKKESGVRGEELRSVREKKGGERKGKIR